MAIFQTRHPAPYDRPEAQFDRLPAAFRAIQAAAATAGQNVDVDLHGIAKRAADLTARLDEQARAGESEWGIEAMALVGMLDNQEISRAASDGADIDLDYLAGAIFDSGRAEAIETLLMVGSASVPDALTICAHLARTNPADAEAIGQAVARVLGADENA
jgi:hypothetical protein